MIETLTSLPDQAPYLQALTVAVNYEDILRLTSANLRHFDRWLIVTSAEDLKTQHLCQTLGIDFIISKRLYANGARFAKAAALNEGLEHLRQDAWVIIMDADILLPADFRDRINTEFLDRSVLYGLKGRKVCVDWSELRLFIHETAWNRLATSDVVLGYFQLFWLAPRIRFSEASQDASYYDMQFADEFGEERQRYLPLGCLHLGPVQTNWKGRKSSPFKIRKNETAEKTELTETFQSILKENGSVHQVVFQWGITNDYVTGILLGQGFTVWLIDSQGLSCHGSGDPILDWDMQALWRKFESTHSTAIQEGRLRILGPATQAVLEEVAFSSGSMIVICGEPESGALEAIRFACDRAPHKDWQIIGMHYDLVNNKPWSGEVNLVFGVPQIIHSSGAWQRKLETFRLGEKTSAPDHLEDQRHGINYIITEAEQLLNLLTSIRDLRRKNQLPVQVTTSVPLPLGLTSELRRLKVSVCCMSYADRHGQESWLDLVPLSRFETTLLLPAGSFIEQPLSRLGSFPGTELLIREDGGTNIAHGKLPSSPWGILWRSDKSSVSDSPWWEKLKERSRNEAMTFQHAGREIREPLNFPPILQSVVDTDAELQFMRRFSPEVKTHAQTPIVTVLVKENYQVFLANCPRWAFSESNPVYIVASDDIPKNEFDKILTRPGWHWLSVRTTSPSAEQRASDILLSLLSTRSWPDGLCYINAGLLPTVAAGLYSTIQLDRYDLIGYCWFKDACRHGYKSAAVLGGLGYIGPRLGAVLGRHQFAAFPFDSIVNHLVCVEALKRSVVSLSELGWFDEKDIEPSALQFI